MNVDLEKIVVEAIEKAKGNTIEFSCKDGLAVTKAILSSFNIFTHKYEKFNISYFYQNNENKFTTVYNLFGTCIIEYVSTRKKAINYAKAV